MDFNEPDRIVRIMMLGFSASGKSTFLAALWHYFGYGDCDGIMFSTDDNSARHLDGHCRELHQGSVGKKVLTAKEWKFTVQARGPSNNLTDAFTLTYIDYDGHELGGAYDAIMGLLDGARIAEIMRDNPDPEYAVWLGQLSLLIAGQGDKPVHLLLTKFDLLDGRYTLGQIAEKLRSWCQPFDRTGPWSAWPAAAGPTTGSTRAPVPAHLSSLPPSPVHLGDTLRRGRGRPRGRLVRLRVRVYDL